MSTNRSYGIRRRIAEVRNLAFFAGLLVGAFGVIILCKMNKQFWEWLKKWVEAVPAT